MKYQQYEPKKCWVGEGQKICYATKEEAEVAARVAEHDHGAPHLSVYQCEFCKEWHLSSIGPFSWKKRSQRQKNLGRF